MKAMWIGKQYLLSISTRRTKFDVGCKMPTGGVLLRSTLVPFLIGNGQGDADE